MALVRWKITLEYDGAAFSGWQRQDNAPSVQQAVEEAMYAFCQQDIRITVAGRTDAGVHAKGQVAHFDLDYGARALSPYDLAKALNALLRPHLVCVRAAEMVSSDFHARFSAVNKLYTYRIVNRQAPPVLDMGKVWHVKKKLDARAMHAAAQVLLGHHDFTSFRDSECQAKTPMRTLDRLDIIARPYNDLGCAGLADQAEEGLHSGQAQSYAQEILVHVEGRSFLHHQVRNMVGSLALVGEGKWTCDDIARVLAAKDRTKAGPTAPADGLYLVRVDYP